MSDTLIFYLDPVVKLWELYSEVVPMQHSCTTPESFQPRIDALRRKLMEVGVTENSLNQYERYIKAACEGLVKYAHREMARRRQDIISDIISYQHKKANALGVELSVVADE